MSDSELGDANRMAGATGSPGSGPRPTKIQTKSWHVRSHSVPQARIPVRPRTLQLTSIIGHLVTPDGRSVLRSPSLPILTVERSSLALSRRHKSLLLGALLACAVLALAFSGYLGYDRYEDEMLLQLARYQQMAPAEVDVSRHAVKDYCPHYRPADESVVSLTSRDPDTLTPVAVALAITSKVKDPEGRQVNITQRNMVSVMPTFHSLVPSFCRTASAGFAYHFFFGYDMDDSHFTRPDFRRLFRNKMVHLMTLYCPLGSLYAVHFVQCRHTRHVSWAQNDAVMEAYLAGMEYFFRINDDTIMETPGWTEAFIWTLGHFDPPNVGVVGPNHKGGNSKVLTYDFVHRTHIELLGYHYPRENGDWDDDVWITLIYRPTRSVKIKYIQLQHTQELGRRYEINTVSSRTRRRVLAEAKDRIHRFIAQRRDNQLEPDPKKMISMSIRQTDSAHLWGAVRNAHLWRTVYPDWSFRVYVTCGGAPISDEVEAFATDVRRVAKTLGRMGVDVRLVDDEVGSRIPPEAWYLLALDDAGLDLVLLRNPDARLSDRDRRLVDDWLAQRNQSDYPVHCVRDHPAHADLPIVHGLWAAAPPEIQKALGQPVRSLLLDYARNHSARSPADFTQNFLNDVIWPRFEYRTLCHDSITCRKWNNSVHFDLPRADVGYLGRKFSEHEERRYPHDMLPFSQIEKSDCE